MNSNSTNQAAAKHELTQYFDELTRSNGNIRLVGICTEDGFDIQSKTDRFHSMDAAKLAAIASSISSLSNSTAQQLNREGFNIVIIETNHGNILFMRARYLGEPCVISMATSNSSSLAQDRFELKRVFKKVQSITAPI
ncbi:MAG: roadblock/LC7 domain-containing protein [Pseudomonadota bacterium]